MKVIREAKWMWTRYKRRGDAEDYYVVFFALEGFHHAGSDEGVLLQLLAELSKLVGVHTNGFDLVAGISFAP